MEQKELVIKVCNDRIYLSPGLSIPIQQTNIPKEHLTFRSREDIFWKVEMRAYNSYDNCLNVKVKDYSTSDISKFNSQQPKKGVKKLLFEKFDWKRLEPLLTVYQKIKLLEVLDNISATPFSGRKFSLPIVPQSNLSTPSTIHIEKGFKPRVTTIAEDFWYYFTNAHFRLGNVTFKKYSKKIEKEIDFEIPNGHILAEFDDVKHWFAKKLKTKKFKVTALITLTDDEITEVLATSKHIDQITPELIDSVKNQRTLALIKEPKVTNPDKALFTAEEIFTQFGTGDIEGSVFKQSEDDILNFLVEEKNSRNKKQLAYLAGKKHAENHKIRFTLNPNFGFLFLVEGVENNHFIWELLNSHATYIWSIKKQQMQIELQFKGIESIINTIRTNGREDYKRAYRNNHKANDLFFTVINHEEIASSPVDGFPKWRGKLDEQLT